MRRGADVVVKKRKIRKLSENARCLRAILRTAIDAIVTIEESGVVESINPAAERMFGYTRDELVGHNVSILMPSRQAYRQRRHRPLPASPFASDSMTLRVVQASGLRAMGH